LRARCTAWANEPFPFRWRIILTGACGFVGSTIVRQLLAEWPGLEIVGFDHLGREGAELNRDRLRRLGVELVHGDLRCASDLADWPKADWVIDAAANPSVLAGLTGEGGSRRLVEHNLLGTVNVLEYCRRHGAGLVLLSTSRVYSLPPLAGLPLKKTGLAYGLDTSKELPPGVSAEGVAEGFSTAPPVSLYGVTKLASEQLALEYGATFGFPVWIDRCGVLAGEGQFGRADQGIFAYWINAWLRGRPLKYIGFDGTGAQSRDCLHPADLVPLLRRQLTEPSRPVARIQNVAGGRTQTMSLAELSAWCAARFGPREVASDPVPRPFDVAWLTLDAGLAGRQWDWRPVTPLETVLGRIADHAEKNPRWLELSGTR
jgi:CDP-paratose 2-epimerase